MRTVTEATHLESVNDIFLTIFMVCCYVQHAKGS